MNYVQQASKQLAPAYTQQTNALQSQIPAIQQLYQSLFGQLQSQGQVQNQNILEGASARGILDSTIPVDAQTGLQQSLIAQQGQLAGQQAKDIGGVQSSLAGIGVDKSNAIAQLAQTLQNSVLAQQQFGYTKQQSNKQYNLQKQLADRTYQLNKQAIYY
jgi:hypothetical protein